MFKFAVFHNFQFIYIYNKNYIYNKSKIILFDIF